MHYQQQLYNNKTNKIMELALLLAFSAALMYLAIKYWNGNGGGGSTPGFGNTGDEKPSEPSKPTPMR